MLRSGVGWCVELCVWGGMREHERPPGEPGGRLGWAVGCGAWVGEVGAGQGCGGVVLALVALSLAASEAASAWESRAMSMVWARL